LYKYARDVMSRSHVESWKKNYRSHVITCAVHVVVAVDFFLFFIFK
jgi:hypothetical protein